MEKAKRGKGKRTGKRRKLTPLTNPPWEYIPEVVSAVESAELYKQLAALVVEKSEGKEDTHSAAI